MRQVTTALIAMTWLAFSAWDSALVQAQNPVSVGLRNHTDTNLIVQGYSIVQGTQRRGQVLSVAKRGMAFESNVPSGLRYYTIHDANQPSRILLRDYPVVIQTRDTTVIIETSKTDSTRIILRSIP